MGALVAALLTLTVQQIESRRAERKADQRRSEAKTRAASERVQKRNQLIQKIRESRETPTAMSFREEPESSQTTLQSLRFDAGRTPPATVSTPGETGLSL